MLKKTQVLAMLNDLPDSFSIEELVERLLLIQKIELGLIQSMTGQTMSLKEAKERFAKMFP